MKHATKTRNMLLGAMFAAPLALAAPPTVDGGGKADATATAEATAEASGNKSSHKQSVTVTSDGTRTVKKTVTVRDGVEETVIEITGPDGKTTTTKEPNQPPQDQPADKPDTPWLGVRVKEAPAVLREQLQLAPDEGVVVDLVAPGSPAAKANIQVNDILLKLADAKLSTPESLRAEIQSHAVGETVPLEFLRKGERQTVDVTLEAAPDNDPQEGAPPAAAEMLEDARARHHAGPGKIKIEIDSDVQGLDAGAGLDAVLDNPNVPEEFKKTVREMKKRMEEFQKKHAVD